MVTQKQVLIGVNADPQPGLEFEYMMAWKHRVNSFQIYCDTPWWQYKKSRRRYKTWLRALDRIREFGQDRILSA